jgi:ergothioneine biosynthesis protein EgtB
MASPLIHDLQRAWERSDALFALLADGALFERPIALRHPYVFYLGHLPAFAWNQIARGVLGERPFRPEFDELFERGIDPLDEAAAGSVSIGAWPEVDEIVAYRDRVRRELTVLLETLPADDPGDPLRDRHRIAHVVLEHELMHHETLLYMFHELAYERKRPPVGAPAAVQGGAPAGDAIEIPRGTVTLGASFESLPFGWDNEFPEERVETAAFRLARYPVTQGDYLEFVEAGGYGERRYWSDDDWSWVERHGLRHPAVWERTAGRWSRRAMFERLPLDACAGWPAMVSGAEAAAYARFRGARLPTEAELHRAAYGAPDGGERPFPWGDEAPGPRHGNFDGLRFDAVPVGSHPGGRSAFGVEELVGNGWEWTATPFAARPGFTPWIRTYPGYSADFFDGQHVVVFGAAWPTDRRFLRRSFRNWFQPRYPYVFSTFRLAWDL